MVWFHESSLHFCPCTALNITALCFQPSFCNNTHSSKAIEGDFISESATRHHLDAKKLIPDEVLVAQGSSLETCASKVSAEYETLKGMDQASAILTFMTIAQTLPQYGMHFFQVKDKSGVPWLLGVSPRGIGQFYFSNPNTPRQVRLDTERSPRK